jgi:hypothetical protein
MRILCLIVLAVLSGCSSQPQTASTLAPATTPALANAASTESTAAKVTTPSEFNPPAGYRKREENGRVFYCAKLKVLGTRFAKEDCRTQRELEDLEQQKASMRGEMDQRKSVCTSAAGCANP